MSLKNNHSIFEIVEYNDILCQFGDLCVMSFEDSILCLETNDLKRDFLDKCGVLEIIFETTNRDKEHFDKTWDTLIYYIQNLIVSIGEQFYVFTTDYNAKLISRLRSYKGILPKNLINEYSIQKEIFIGGKLSIIAAIVKINTLNIDSSIDLFTQKGNEYSFIVYVENKSIFSNDFIDFIVTKCTKHGSNSELDYNKLIEYFFINDGLLIKLGGDGVNYFSFQIIYNNKYNSQYFLDKLIIINNLQINNIL